MSLLRPIHPLDSAGEGGAPRAESVTEFTRRVKVLLESQLHAGWVRGEVSNLRIQASGHVYFSLKDAGAQLSAVMFRGDAARQAVALRDGMQVVVFGQVSVYEARGQYQLIVRLVVEDGVGRLQREFEALKRKLAAEGLFASERKRPVPALPRTVGFITSPTGAAVQDFCRILTRRGWRGRVVVLPARVQGEGAAADMIAMLEEAARLGMFDLLVIGRGGGSIEDLWAFNEEGLVRAVAACPVPVVSAVGHEIDFTLCDFAADVRAETPSGAAELISSGFVRERERFQQLAEGLRRELVTAVGEASRRLDHARARLRLLAPSAQVERGFLRLDDLGNRLQASLTQSVRARRQRFTELRAAFRERSPETRVQIESHRLLGLWKRLQAASPESVLNRGFVILRDEATGQPVQRRAELAKLKAGARLRAQFADGEAELSAPSARTTKPKG
ncbi:exodeoxyribonuclease VII large subunit [Opitutaceae bacterium TAV4]|nr:exodeoxyribonuclease VII large subunit [Opitutaceae bacterium TAV4]RRJ98615.1 exodeoxyribonuclease VII large subunit [Opitutaceae bacterium TAV3]